MELKAIKILRKELNEWKQFTQKNVYNNSQKYRKIVDKNIEKFKNAIAELEELVEKDKSKKCEGCYSETNRVLAIVEQRESDAKHTTIKLIRKLIRKLEELENKFKREQENNLSSEIAKTELGEMTIQKYIEALENRKCTDCKFFTKKNVFYGVCAKDVNTTKNQDEWLSNIEFSCNRFEQKES